MYGIRRAVHIAEIFMRIQSEKREKFVKLAEGRTQTALQAIRKLGNLSNRRAYDYTEADIKKIANVLKDAITEVERKFGSSGESSDVFKL